MATFEPFNKLKSCRYGQMLYNWHDAYIGRSLDLYGEYSEGEVELFRQLVKPGHFVIEAGANIGAHTVALAQQVGPTGAVMAFEPQRLIFQTLCANLALNSITNVICHNTGLGAEAGTAFVPPINYWKENNLGALNLKTFHEGEQVPVVTLDSLKLARCDFLKADVEGMEQDVLRGASALIARHKPILYVENDKADAQIDLILYVESLGYRMYWHMPYYFNPRNFLQNEENVFPDVVSMNMLCVPKEYPQDVGLEPVQLLALDPET